jgi:lipopolysaccharide export system permease protein
MRILDRHIIGEFTKIFIICAGGFVLMFLLIELPDKIKNYFQYDPHPWLMVKYFLCKTPGYLYYVVPLGFLISAMLTLLIMARNSEIIAMQASGVDAIDIARPMFIIGLVGAAGMFLLNETLIPWSNRKSEEIEKVEIAKKEERTLYKGGKIWFRTPEAVTYVARFIPESNSLEDVTIVQMDEDYNFLQRLHAIKARWWDGKWIFYGVNRTRLNSEGKFVVDTVASMKGPLEKPPSDFKRVERLAIEMNLWRLSDYIKKLEEEGHPTHRYLVDWHNKIAFPFVCLIMALLGVPFALKVNPRGGGVAIGLGLSVAIAFGYWVAHTLFIALGHGGYLVPVVSAWAANAIFGLLAFMSLLQAGA